MPSYPGFIPHRPRSRVSQLVVNTVPVQNGINPFEDHFNQVRAPSARSSHSSDTSTSSTLVEDPNTDSTDPIWLGDDIAIPLEYMFPTSDQPEHPFAPSPIQVHRPLRYSFSRPSGHSAPSKPSNTSNAPPPLPAPPIAPRLWLHRRRHERPNSTYTTPAPSTSTSSPFDPSTTGAQASTTSPNRSFFLTSLWHSRWPKTDEEDSPIFGQTTPRPPTPSRQQQRCYQRLSDDHSVKNVSQNQDQILSHPIKDKEGLPTKRARPTSTISKSSTVTVQPPRSILTRADSKASRNTTGTHKMGGGTVKFVEKPKKWEYDCEDPFSDEECGYGKNGAKRRRTTGYAVRKDAEDEDEEEDIDEGFAEVERKNSKRRLMLRSASPASTIGGKKKCPNEVYWGKGRGLHGDDLDDLEYDDLMPYSLSHSLSTSHSHSSTTSKRNVRKSASEGVLKRLASGKSPSSGQGKGNGHGHERGQSGESGAKATKGTVRGISQVQKPMISGPFPLAKASSVKDLREAVKQERRGVGRPAPPIPVKKEKGLSPIPPPQAPSVPHRSRSTKKPGVGDTGATAVGLRVKAIEASLGEREREEHMKSKKGQSRLKNIWPWSGTHIGSS